MASDILGSHARHGGMIRHLEELPDFLHIKAQVARVADEL
jgi:hypothetical protein